MDNFKFNALLESTPLSDEDRYNLSTIFRALSDARKQDIMDHWDVYLAGILEIHGKGEKEKKELIEKTFSHINKLIDEAYLRDQERKKEQELVERQRNDDILASMQYEQERRLSIMKKMTEKEIQARNTLEDPLSYL